MIQGPIHACHEIEYTGTFNDLGPEVAHRLANAESGLRIVAALQAINDGPTKVVIEDYRIRHGMTERTPEALLGQVSQWHCLIRRYISGEVVITPQNTAQTWGGPVESEEEFVFVGCGVLAITSSLISAYEAFYSPEAGARPKLNEYQRDLVRAHFAWGHDVTEIADHLGVDIDAVWFEHVAWVKEQLIAAGIADESGSEE